MLDRFLRPAQIKTNQDGALLRLIACICMFIDHAGKMLFPQLTWMRWSDGWLFRCSLTALPSARR